MKLGVLLAFLIYYAVMISIFNFGGIYLAGATSTFTSPVNEGYYPLNDTPAINSTQYIEGGSNLFGGLWNVIKQGISTLGFIFFGIGLPPNTPLWFAWGFALIETLITILAGAFLYDSVWGGG